MRLVVYCTAAQRRVLRCSRGTLWHEAIFTADEAGLGAFAEYLGSRGGSTATLIADVAGEEFREEQIPLLRGRDRDAVLRRRLTQQFPEARLAAALSLGRAGPQARKERLLLAALPESPQLAPWLEALAAARVRLAGVYSTALLAPALAPREARCAPLCILASVHAEGLRLCCLENGRLRFARFEGLEALADDAYALRARAEVARLADYLATLQALPAEAQPWPLFVIAPAAHRAAFERAFASEAQIQLRFEALEEAARRLGQGEAPPGLGAERLALALAPWRAPRKQYARAEDLRSHRRGRARRAWIAGAGLALAACAAYAGVQGVEVLRMREEANALRREALDLRQRHEQTRASLPAMPTSAENLRIAVEELRRLAARTAMPEEALAHVAGALEHLPQVALESLHWSVAPATAASSAAANASVQTIEMGARLDAMAGGNLDAVEAEMDRFATALQKDSRWQIVRAARAPEMPGSGRAAARFTLVISRAPE